MRSQSVQKSKDRSPLYDGFTSDYYSYHNLEKRKNHNLRKFTFNSHWEEQSDESAKEKEVLKHHKRIFCFPLGYQCEIKNILTELTKYLNFDCGGTEITVEQVKTVMIFKFDKIKDKFIFLFDFGVLIMWSFDEKDEQEISNIFFNNCKFLLKNSYKSALDDDMNLFHFRRGEIFNISNRNKISIESNDMYEILSVSYALGQHTILTHYENEVAITIEETKRIPIEMRDKGQINLPKKEISRSIGLIFMRRSAVSLNSGIIDTPDLFWEQKTEIEIYYSTVRKYMEIDKRVEILDRRMKILKELYDVMNNEIKTQGKFRLEWIVVYLVVIEIFVSVFWKMLVKDILKLY